MNVEMLNRLVRTSGKTKKQIADECGISRVTLDAILASGDMKVSTLEGLADALGVWPGILFDDPAGMIRQTGGQNNINGNNVRSEGYIPSEVLEMFEAKDRQMERLIVLLEHTAGLGKFSATDIDAPALGKFSATDIDAPATL